MPIQIRALGGFSKTEGNSVAIKVDDEVVILDMGLSMENYILHTEDREEVSNYEDLLKAKALPDYSPIEDWKDQVKAIAISHAHLDHVGAVPFAAPLFPHAPVIATPYTKEVLQTIITDENINVPNKLIAVELNSTYKVSKNLEIEFVNVTHSVPQAAIIVLHTKYGKIVYANDFKLDPLPVLGDKPNFKRLKQIGKEGVALLIMNCLYIHEHRKCPSESVAKEMLRDVLLGIKSENKALLITTFSSHLSRLKSIIELGRKLNRKIVFLGRSLSKYVSAAEKLELVNFTKDVQMVAYRDKVEKVLRKIEKEGKENYLIVCTGHQGEPKAVLSRIARGELDFKFSAGDAIIFSCNVIPVEVNQKNREKLEKNLEAQGVRIFKDVHVSGHAFREDHREMLEMLQPDLVIPIHAGPDKGKQMGEWAKQLKISTKVLQDGEELTLS